MEAAPFSFFMGGEPHMKKKSDGHRLGGNRLLTASPFLIPSLIGFAIFYFAPMVISVFISLTDWNGLDRLFAEGFVKQHFIGLTNYRDILASPEFWKVLKNTFTYIILYIPLMLIVSMLSGCLSTLIRRTVNQNIQSIDTIMNDDGSVQTQKPTAPANTQPAATPAATQEASSSGSGTSQTNTNPTNPGASDTAKNGLRFDGIYCNINDWDADGKVDCYVFRFYPDGTMIRRSLEQYDSTYLFFPTEKDFNRDTAEYKAYYGNWTLDDDWIEFTTVSSTGTVDYWGTVSTNLLRLDNHSNINGNEASDRPYIFLPFDYIPDWNSTGSGDTDLRYDGVYCNINDWDSDGKIDCYLFRFYPDGTMIRRSIEQYDETELFFPRERDFNRDTDEYRTYNAGYTVEDDWIEFSTISSTGTVDYWGTLGHNIMRLDNHSNINGNEASNRPYIFIPFDYIPGWND